jgi:HlyB family type I secretion system ABC transporter
MNISKTLQDHLLQECRGKKWATKTYRRGEIICQSTPKQEFIIIWSGRGRIIDRSKTFGMETLSLIQAPFLAGISGHLSREIDEYVIACDECEGGLVELDANEASTLLKQAVLVSELPWLSHCIRNWLGSRGKLEEESATALASFDEFKTDIRIIDRQLLLTPSRQDTEIYIYADRPQKGFSYGEILSAATLSKAFDKEVFPRVISWNAKRDQAAVSGTADSSQQIIASNAMRNRTTQRDLASNDDQPGVVDLKLQRASDPVSAHAAVLKMIFKLCDLPIRRDVLKRAAEFINQSKSKSCLDQYVVILEQLGLETRILQTYPDELDRLPVPLIIQTGERQACLLHRNAEHTLTLYNPLSGTSPWTQDDPEEASEVMRVIHVFRGPNTPEQRFDAKWILPFIAKYKSQLVEVFVASLFTQLFALASPLLFQQIIDRVIGQRADDSLLSLAVLMVLFALLEIIFSSLRTFQFSEISNRIDIEMGSSIIGRLLRLNARYFEQRPVGELASRLNELENIRRFLTGTALTVCLDAIFASLYLVVMFFYSQLLTWIILITLPLLFIATVGVSPLTQRLLRQRSEAFAKTQSLMVEILNGIQTIKLQTAESVTRKNWEQKHLLTINRGFKTILANTASNNSLQLINKLSSIVVIVVGAMLVLKNEMTLGELIAFRIISSNVTQPLLRLASAWQGFQETTLSFERLADVINQPVESLEHERNQLVMPELKGEININHVSFSYSQQADAQLSGVSIRIPMGSFTGIVGQSGCGKSTLLKLIPRLYRPSNGQIFVDGIDISKVELYSYRNQLGYVPQECLLFEGSILSNLTISDPEIEMDAVVHASRLACAHDFIMSLPYGYSTPVGEKGAGLSGGQRQRIALARMLLQNPKMIILDEATSALDVDTELQVVNNIRQAAKNKTMLMITHRLSTLKTADQIVVMHEGRVDSCGTHVELMKLQGRYHVLYQQQFAGDL